MLRRAYYLKSYSVRATDGTVGPAKDFLFDDRHWVTRYLVVNTGGWLQGRKVLISPYAIENVDPYLQIIEVALSQEEIERGPSLEEHQPVSRRYEAEYLRHYQWPYYWYGPELWGPGPIPRAEKAQPAPRSPEEASDDEHLRSANEVTGYHIAGRDGELGHVEDYIIDDENWAIRYLVVDTVNWWPGKKVLLPPQWLTSIDWRERKVHVELERDTIKQAPPFDDSTILTRDYEEKLFRHYGREGYWAMAFTMAGASW